MARSSLAPLVLVCLALVSAGVAFVGAPAAGAASGAQVALRGASSARFSSSQTFGASSSTFPVASLAIAAGAAAVCLKAAKKDAGPSGEEIAKTLPRPEDLLESPKFPKFQGSSGGYFSKSTRERHAITWTAKEEAEIELPTGTVAIMNKGENLCYFRKKEQAICVGKALRKMKIENYKIFRIAKDGTVMFMHPADGVFPDKVNKGRVATNFRPFSCGSNAVQGLFKYTKYHQKAYEADALSTMFVKAKMEALNDGENLFPLPQQLDLEFSGMTEEEKADYNKRYNEAYNKAVKKQSL